MTKIVLQDVASLTNETAALNTLNSNSAVIETASDSFLSRDGTSPNEMLADLDMNSQRILNLPEPINASEPLRLQDLGTLNGGGSIGTLQANYVVTSANASLTNERVLTGGSGLTLADGGAGGNVTLNVGAGTGITVNADDVAITVPVTVPNGGTGVTAHTAGGILYGNGGSAIGSARATIDSTQSISSVSSSNSTPQYNLINTTSDASGPYYILNKSRSGGNTNNGDSLGQLLFRGTANSAFNPGAQISVQQTAASSGSNVPSVINFHTSNASGQLNKFWQMDGTIGSFNTPAGGSIGMFGSSSGAVSVQVPAAAGSTTFRLPGNNGSNGQVLTTDGTGVTSWAGISGGLSTTPRQSTNLLSAPINGKNLWTKEGSSADIIEDRYSIVTSGTTQRLFDYRVLQMFLNAAGSITTSHPTIVPVDLTQPYRYAIYAADPGGGTLNLIVEPINTNGDVISTLTITTGTLPANFADNTSELGGTINANGGSAPAWPAGTVGARIRITDTVASQNRWIAGAWFIQMQRLPNTNFTKVQSTAGGGAHEGYWDGTNLYVISHTYGQLAKFDANMVRQGIVTTSSYPHCLTALGGDIWLVTQIGQTLQQINKSAMTVTNTFAVNGARDAFGIDTDGTDLYLGVGNSSTGQTPAIIKFTVSGSSQAVLSTDVDGASANIPIVFQNGSVWSIKQALSQVKRINPVGGSTIATITTSIGGIYGLGGDGTFIYAAGEMGVAVIDSGSNTVVSTYFFSKQYGMGGNPRVDSLGQMWGCSRNGLWVLKQSTGVFTEIPNVLGGVKWTTPMANGKVAVGYYGVPSIDIY